MQTRCQKAGCTFTYNYHCSHSFSLTDTCLEYRASENDAVANPAVCLPDSELTAAAVTTRNNTLTHDYTSCTQWTSLVSTNNATCVEGVTNEGNCGYGPGVSTELCTACDPTGNVTISSCCYDEKTDLSSCASYGHPGAAAVRATASASPGFVSSTSSAGGSGATGGSSSAGSNASNDVGSTGLTGGQLAGIIVGSIIGALLIGALLAWLLFGRKRNNKDPEASRGLVYGGAGRSSSGEKPWNQSETGTTRSLGESPMGEKNQSPASGDHAKLAAVGAGTAGIGAGAIGAGALGSSSHNTSPQARPDSQLSSGTGGSDGRGTTVAQVKDQYTGQDIFPGEEVIAIYPYNASLNDELTLEPDQKVTIVRLYDDGWALGRTKDGHEGALPLVCVSSTKGEIPGRGGNGTGTGTSDDEGLTSGAEYTSSVDGAVTAEEGGFTSDATGYRSARSGQR